LVAVGDEIVHPFSNLQRLDIFPLASGSHHRCPQIVIGRPQRLNEARGSIHVALAYQILKRLADRAALVEVWVLLRGPVERLGHLLRGKIALALEIAGQLLGRAGGRGCPLRSSDRLTLGRPSLRLLWHRHLRRLSRRLLLLLR
jgi:hypothetical protein